MIDHDVRVLARKTVRVKAFRLGEALDWAAGQARPKGVGAVAVACEPAGPRWLQVQRLCAERGLPLVCVQPLVTHIAREQQDFTMHKTDEADCVMITRLAAELHCYVPEGTRMSPPAARTTRLPPATRRQPDQRVPHHVTGALTRAFPPDEGRASPPRR